MAGAKAWISPAGRLHAVDPERQTVLCGEPIRSLVPFPEMLWSGITSGVRCRDCTTVLQTEATASGALGA
ncbi:MAG TPA: hypothetical protein VFH58_10290 [Acidimicrobiales bacterium]|nr:hypothetical protein [Acidimicrobiales bacterium]